MFGRSNFPKHCKAPMSGMAGDGIWECLRCGRWAHFPKGVPQQVRGRDLEDFHVTYDRLMR